jgi:arsenite methyltransferase
LKSYLLNIFDSENSDHVAIVDELPLWSAPFGLTLLDAMKFEPNIKCLDIGSGTGFPLIEIAHRLGSTCKVYGVDPWKEACDRIKNKIAIYKLINVEVINCPAEELPFVNNFFDLIVSNNGINNVHDIDKVFSECFRVIKPGGQFLFTFNLPRTMIKFYEIFKSVLEKLGLKNEIEKMNEHINEKRRPVEYMEKKVVKAGFKIINKIEKSFKMRYLDGTSFFNHFVIRSHFLPSWKEILPKHRVEEIFEILETSLNDYSKKRGELSLIIPYVCLDCQR